MSDLCRVLIAGHLSSDLERRVRDDGVIYGACALCAARTYLVAGHPVTETTYVTIEVIGATRLASVAQQFGAGSRVLAEGHLETRETTRIERLRLASGVGEVAVRVTRAELVMVVDTLFNASSPLPAADAERQPDRRWWADER